MDDKTGGLGRLTSLMGESTGSELDCSGLRVIGARGSGPEAASDRGAIGDGGATLGAADGGGIFGEKTSES